MDLLQPEDEIFVGFSSVETPLPQSPANIAHRQWLLEPFNGSFTTMGLASPFFDLSTLPLDQTKKNPAERLLWGSKTLEAPQFIQPKSPAFKSLSQSFEFIVDLKSSSPSFTIQSFVSNNITKIATSNLYFSTISSFSFQDYPVTPVHRKQELIIQGFHVNFAVAQFGPDIYSAAARPRKEKLYMPKSRITGCNLNDLKQSEEAYYMKGSWVLISRGECEFAAKVNNLQIIGAVGVVVADDKGKKKPGQGEDLVIMRNSEEKIYKIFIPSLFIVRKDSERYRVMVKSDKPPKERYLSLYLASNYYNSGEHGNSPSEVGLFSALHLPERLKNHIEVILERETETRHDPQFRGCQQLNYLPIKQSEVENLMIRKEAPYSRRLVSWFMKCIPDEVIIDANVHQDALLKLLHGERFSNPIEALDFVLNIKDKEVKKRKTLLDLKIIPSFIEQEAQLVSENSGFVKNLYLKLLEKSNILHMTPENKTFGEILMFKKPEQNEVRISELVEGVSLVLDEQPNVTLNLLLNLSFPRYSPSINSFQWEIEPGIKQLHIVWDREASSFLVLSSGIENKGFEMNFLELEEGASMKSYRQYVERYMIATEKDPSVIQTYNSMRTGKGVVSLAFNTVRASLRVNGSKNTSQEEEETEEYIKKCKMAQSSWYYKNPEGVVQGPFTNDEMLQWYAAGYLPNDLLIAQGQNREFSPLQAVFPVPGSAFTSAGQQVDEMAVEKWFFLDRSRNVQGPFSGYQMLQWLNDGYFEKNLQIYDASKPEESFGWKSLQEYFPNMGEAFTPGYENAPPVSSGFSGGGQPGEDRFDFPRNLPVPPPYRGVRKVYPSEKNV
eukprot:augustus_masked-scaffold_7-processed-gene-1.56-mRNA-1 protein AED:0.39 eAED:0.41 QI:0/0/0/0.33/1/1/3/0/835